MATRANPFPGMNPYLEQRWGDVHVRLIASVADALQESLPDDLRARMQERVFVESSAGSDQAYYPDVSIIEHRGSAGPHQAQAGAAVAEPLVIRVPEVERREAFIEIIDWRSGGRVITVIEVLSPSNKSPGRGRELYEQKQSEMVEAGVNLVEIDLLRGGRWTTRPAIHSIPAAHRTPFHVSVSRATARSAVEYYAIPLRQRLPIIRIPLRPADADVTLDLQAIIGLVHLRGRYDDIDYAAPLDPPLGPDDAAWVRELLGSSQTS